MSVCLSVCLSVRPSVRLSVCPDQNCSQTCSNVSKHAPMNFSTCPDWGKHVFSRKFSNSAKFHFFAFSALKPPKLAFSRPNLAHSQFARHATLFPLQTTQNSTYADFHFFRISPLTPFKLAFSRPNFAEGSLTHRLEPGRLQNIRDKAAVADLSNPGEPGNVDLIQASNPGGFKT